MIADQALISMGAYWVEHIVCCIITITYYYYNVLKSWYSYDNRNFAAEILESVEA